MGLLSNRIDRKKLKPGDHIYSWRAAYIYAHHGIYIGDDKVIHFTRRGQEVGTGNVMDHLLVSSVPASRAPCPTCSMQDEGHGVILSCLDCFLFGGVLYRFEYAVNPALFLAKVRGGTCTLAVSDPNDVVVHRANYLLEKGFGCYDVLTNNCEHFAIYCKTGLVVDKGTLGQIGLAESIVGVPIGTALSRLLGLVTITNVYGMAAHAFGTYCVNRYVTDIGKRKDVIKVSVEDLTRRLDSPSLQVVENQI